MTFRLDRLEHESTLSSERVSSLTRICQLQQQFQENWEEEQAGIKRYIEERIKANYAFMQDGKQGISLKDELELKSSSGFENLQEQINKLGEEIALDINDLEKRLNALLTHKPQLSIPTAHGGLSNITTPLNLNAPTSPFLNTYSTMHPQPSALESPGLLQKIQT